MRSQSDLPCWLCCWSVFFFFFGACPLQMPSPQKQSERFGKRWMWCWRTRRRSWTSCRPTRERGRTSERYVHPPLHRRTHSCRITRRRAFMRWWRCRLSFIRCCFRNLYHFFLTQMSRIKQMINFGFKDQRNDLHGPLNQFCLLASVCF